MKKLSDLIEKASDSDFYRWLLNRLLSWAVPFNSPHKFRIIRISPEDIEITMPYFRRNLNHIKGLHACGLATLCEYACGLQLSRYLEPDRYRLIMQQLNMEYFYQGKNTAKVIFRLDESWINQEIISPLETVESILKTFELKVFDQQDNHLCTAKVTWQIKDWKNVKTKTK